MSQEQGYGLGWSEGALSSVGFPGQVIPQGGSMDL